MIEIDGDGDQRGFMSFNDPSNINVTRPLRFYTK